MDKDKYAMYLRKSRIDLELEALGEGETLARHRKMLFDLAARYDILPDQIEIYHEVVSGDSLSERPEAQRLLDDVHAKKFKGVLVTEIERLARGNTMDQGEVAEAFSLSGTYIITPSKFYDPNKESDEEYFEFGLFMSRREFKTIRRRLIVGKDQAVEEGNFLPPVPPYGFDVVRKSRKERVLIEKPEESRIVKMIFDWYTEDRKPTSWIANQLTQMGIPTRRGNVDWARATIKDILFNAHYIGMISWGEQETIKVKDPVTGKLVKKRKNTGKKRYSKGKHKGFISEEQFAKVKTIYGKNAPAKVNTELVNPLSGILRCSACDKAIGFQQHFTCNRAPRYFHPRGTVCKKKSMARDTVIDAVIAALKASIADCELKMKQNDNRAEFERHQVSIAAMEAELKKQENRRRKLFDSWESEDGMYTKEEFIERKQLYNQTIESLKAQIKEAKANAPAQVDYSERITTLHAIIDCLTEPNVSAAEKNIFLKQFIEKITYDVEDYGTNKGGKALLELYLR